MHALYMKRDKAGFLQRTRQNFKGEEELPFKTGAGFASKELWRPWQPFRPEAPLPRAFISHTSP